jgi:hypothetical protein
MEYKKYETNNDNQHYFTAQNKPEVKVQNYLSDKKTQKRKSLQCCLVCKANWEFVTVFTICLIVWAGCLTVYVQCEMDKYKQINLDMVQNEINITRTDRDSRDMKGQSWKNNSNPFVQITTPSTKLENTTLLPRSYFPLKLKTSADTSSVMAVTNSVSDCKLFLIWLSIFSGGLGLFGLVGAFCCCSQI